MASYSSLRIITRQMHTEVKQRREIVGDAHTHAVMCDLISHLPKAMDWIVASRFTGLLRPLAEDRCYELAFLDDIGVQELVNNWFTHAPSADGVARSALFLKELFANNRLLTMARNPFLLSALCYLRSVVPEDQDLPLTPNFKPPALPVRCE